MRRTLLVTSTAETFFPASDWMPVTGFVAVDYLMNLISTSGATAEAKPGVQLATVRTDKAGAGAAIAAGSYESTVNMHQFREVAGYANYAFIRLGFMAKLATGQTGQGVLELEMDAAIKHCGAVLGTKVVDVQPFVTGTDDANTAIVPITEWSPTVGVDKLKGIFLVLDNQNTALEYQLLVRSAKDKMSPGSWVAVEGAFTNPASGNSERNTGEQPVPAGANFTTRSVFQLGLAFRKKSGSSGNPRAIVHTLCHVKYN